jgi:hypothetical protein
MSDCRLSFSTIDDSWLRIWTPKFRKLSSHSEPSSVKMSSSRFFFGDDFLKIDFKMTPSCAEFLSPIIPNDFLVTTSLGSWYSLVMRLNNHENPIKKTEIISRKKIKINTGDISGVMSFLAKNTLID